MPPLDIPVEIRLLGPGDLHVFDRIAPETFDNAISPRWAAEFLADPRHHLVAAMADGELVGFASAVHYVHPDKGPELWINEVGVSSWFRRRGVARRLMRALLAHGQALGCTEAWLGTEEDNVAARRLYAGVGGHEEPTVYVTFALQPR